MGVLYPGVFRVEGSPRAWHQALKAATLWAARGVVVSHTAAAALLGFDRYRAGPLELTVTRHLRPPAGLTLHQVAALPSKELTTVQGIGVTSATRTLLDLAAVEPEAMVQAAVDQALRRKWTTLEKLEVATAQRSGQRGIVFVRDLVNRYRGGDGPGESELEARVRELLDAEGFPRPETQRVVMVGGRLRRIDFRIPGTRVVIEADGYAHHSSPEAFEKDRDRNNALAARGLVVLHWTWVRLCEQPEVLIERLRETLRRAA